MRSRERLIEVLRSVNRQAYMITSQILHDAAGRLAGERKGPVEVPDELARIARYHPSPHIRELAAEALHYLTGEQS